MCEPGNVLSSIFYVQWWVFIRCGSLKCHLKVSNWKTVLALVKHIWLLYCLTMYVWCERSYKVDPISLSPY